MINKLLLAACAFVLVGAVANAQVNNPGGSLALTGTVDGSILLTFHQDTSGGITLQTGDGTAAAAATLSTVSMYGTAAGIVAGSNFVKANQSDGFTLTGTYKVEVNQANTGSSTCDIKAALQSSDAAHTWTLNGTGLTTTAQTVDAGASYAIQNLQTLVLKVPAAAASGAISNSILYTANPL